MIITKTNIEISELLTSLIKLNKNETMISFMVYYTLENLDKT